MVAAKDIDRFARQIAHEFSPEKIVLFGSYANGNPSDDSDVDVLVIMRHEKRNVEQALEIDHKIDRRFPLDLIVRTPREIDRRLALRDVFTRAILKNGRVLYERSR